MWRNNYYTPGNWLDFFYLQNYYKLIGIDLSRQTNTSILQQINFTGKLEEDNGAKMFFITRKERKTIFKLFFRFINKNNGTSKATKFIEGSKLF